MKALYIYMAIAAIILLIVVALHQHEQRQKQEIEQVIREANQSLQHIQSEHEQTLLSMQN